MEKIIDIPTIKARTIVTRNKSNSWFGYEYNMNIYRGCNHGCLYCDSRWDTYKVDDFDTIRAKDDTLRIIRNDLASKRLKGIICTGAMSDPYNPLEARLNLTRNSLMLISAYNFGVSVITKSTLVTRDTEILIDIAEKAPVIVKITITTSDDKLSKIIEPNAPPSSERFNALKHLTDQGIFAGVLLMPILPFITDNVENIEKLVDESAKAGAKFIFARFDVTLRGNQRDWYFNKLDKLFPGLSTKYKTLYGDTAFCSSPKAKELNSLFRQKCKQYGILYRMKDIVRESRKAYTQPSLFDML